MTFDQNNVQQNLFDEIQNRFQLALISWSQILGSLPDLLPNLIFSGSLFVTFWEFLEIYHSTLPSLESQYHKYSTMSQTKLISFFPFIFIPFPRQYQWLENLQPFVMSVLLQIKSNQITFNYLSVDVFSTFALIGDTFPSWNWNLKMLVFEERGKPEYPERYLYITLISYVHINL